MKKAKVGLVVGKFMPFHKGHEYLFRFAKQYCDELVIVVDCLENQTISPELRKQWIEELVVGVRVVALTKFMPQQPEDTPDFWPIWTEALHEAVGGKPDVLIAAMDYGWNLARELGCEFVQCDISRESVPISATEIRANPMVNWRYLAESARGHFMKKVCFMGPESTGKSTCAARVAQALDTVYVPEYAKAVIKSQGGQFFERNVEEVAIAQTRSERALERMVNRVMVCDTDVLTTLIWSEFLYGRHPASLDDMVREARYDMTFLFDVDTPWVPDVHRQVVANAQSNEVRNEFLALCKKWLEHFGRPYTLIRGSYASRLSTCIHDCQALIKS